MPDDLLVLVPTRGRPHNALRQIDAFEETGAFRNAHLCYLVDPDDRKLPMYRAEAERPGVFLLEGAPWPKMVHKLDAAAVHFAHEGYAGMAFMGDDHVPRSGGWAQAYVEALAEPGVEVVYGDDLVQGENLCTQWAVSMEWVRALGRMVPAPVEHLYCDNAVMDLARAASALRYLPEVRIEHAHPVAGRGAWDASYQRSNSREQYQADHARYWEWKMAPGGLVTDTLKIKELSAWARS